VAKANAPLLFVDAVGGALAVLGAAVARSLGKSDAVAATTAPLGPLPAEVPTVLEEVGMEVPPVGRLEAVQHEGRRVIWLGEAPLPITLAGARVVPCALHPGDGELERLAMARIVRDQLERLVAAS
jgi:hypothetical protein